MCPKVCSGVWKCDETDIPFQLKGEEIAAGVVTDTDCKQLANFPGTMFTHGPYTHRYMEQ